jgi:hypothetical protein
MLLGSHHNLFDLSARDAPPEDVSGLSLVISERIKASSVAPGSAHQQDQSSDP